VIVKRSRVVLWARSVLYFVKYIVFLSVNVCFWGAHVGAIWRQAKRKAYYETLADALKNVRKRRNGRGPSAS
jgi:hypothetical protein